MKKLFCIVVLVASALCSFANMYVVQDWNPIFKGVDHAIGTNTPDTTYPRRQSVNAVRIDLTDPDVQLFPSPRAPNWGLETNETRSIIVSNYLRNFGLKVATDCNFYNVFPGGSDPTSEGLRSEVTGLSVCTGAVVSVPDGSRWASLLFTSSKEPYLNFTNRVTGTNGMRSYSYVPDIYTAVTGFYPVLTNNHIWDATTLNALYPDSSIHQVQPRTCFGISEDRRYLFLVIIDGRQSGYSDGATDQETATWMALFGASDAIMMDGGGSAAMYKADCAGNPQPLGHSSYIAARGRERITGSHFGIYASDLPSFIYNDQIIPGLTAAMITWATTSNATTQVAYGPTTGLGTLTPLNSEPVLDHIVTVNDLQPGTRYYFQIISTTDTSEYRSCVIPFSTTNVPKSILFGVTNMWLYCTANLDGVNWTDPGYDDTQDIWQAGPGILCIEDNVAVAPKGTILPLDPASGSPPYPYITYYFRTHFVFPVSPVGATLTFTNFLDDGAAFYLNGNEIHRDFLPYPAYNSTIATNYYCSGGDATCPYVFSLSGDILTNVYQGDNVLAVEVHNYRATSPDIAFGCSLSYTAPSPPPAMIYNLASTVGLSNATVTWATLSNATTQVEYGLDLNFGNSTPLDPALSFSHSVPLTGLLPATLYYYRVLSTVDSTQYSATNTFTTHMPPFIYNLSVSPGNTNATITWMTISNSSSQVEYGLTSGLGTVTPLNSTPVTNHVVSLSGLLPLTNYYFRVTSKVGSSTYSSNSTFTTLQFPIYNLSVISGLTNATISWTTASNATSLVEYGVTSALGMSSPLDPTLSTNHSMFLTDLLEGSNYFFRVISSVATTQYVAYGSFSTVYGPLVQLTNTWKFSTNNWDGSNWWAADFDDTGWRSGPALLWADIRPNGNAAVQPKNTRMPNALSTALFTTYYFRSQFNCGNAAGYALVFSNFVDDGAVFYLNGAEIHRLRVPAAPAVITNGTYALSAPSGGDAVSAEIFRLGGDKMTNMVVGDNLLAVEVHNMSNSWDVTFGSAVGLVWATAAESRVRISYTDNVVTVAWDAKACTLQSANDLSGASWADVLGPITKSPCSVTNPVATTFYRLRN